MAHRYVIETPRLKLREMSVADVDFVSTMLADPEVMHHYPTPLSRAEAEGWVERVARNLGMHQERVTVFKGRTHMVFALNWVEHEPAG